MSRANSTIRMAFFAAKPHQHHEADLGQDVDVLPHDPHADGRGQQAHRHDQDDRERQAPAAILRRQHQEDEQHADRKHVEAGIAAGDLLIGQVGPFEREAARQRLLGELLHGVDRGRRTGARQRVALQLGRRIKIVARDAVGPGDVAEIHHAAEHHHVAGGIAGAQPRQIGGLLPERQVGLRGDVIGAAEQVEVVDIGRAEIGLDRVGDVRRSARRASAP